MTKQHKVRDYAGISGRFFIQKRDASGRTTPTTYEESKKLPIIYEKEIHNKLLKRGLSYMYYTLFYANGGAGDGWYFYDDITANPTDNPFQYFILSKSTVRPDWNESNGSNNANAGAQGNGSANAGSRGLAVSDTTGPYLKRVSISQFTNPYKTMEIVFFAQDNPAGAEESGDWGKVDNFEFSCMGFAEGADAGNGGTDSKWGLRSLIGFAPLFQGVTDRINVAEADPYTLVANPTNTSADGYVQDSNRDGYEGDLVFDGYSQSEGLDGYIDLGGSWKSSDGASHHVGRVWTANKTITHFRVTIPAGVNIDNVPKYFKAQELTDADPTNNAHWTDVTLTVSTHTVDQSGNIYSSGDRGYEYELDSPVTTKGFRLYEIEPVDPTSYVSIAEFYTYTAMSPVTISSGSSNNTVRLSIDGGSNWRTFTIPDVIATTDVQDIVDAFNSVILGYEMEAVRSEFGFLWIKGTTQGATSTLDLDSAGNGSTINTTIGLNSSGGSDAGTTETIVKGQYETMTIIYRMDIGLQEGTNA